jgi:ABC-type phosphate transport system substrate-binding protein
VPRLRPVLLLCLGLLAACQPGAPDPTPLPDIGQVFTTPGVFPFVRRWFTAYRQAAGTPSFDAVVLPIDAARSAVEQDQGELLISAAPPPDGWFATPLGHEPLVVILHPQVRVGNLNRGQLADIFSGRATSWRAFGAGDIPIQPIIPIDGDEWRQLFQEVALGGGPFASTALLAPTPAAMLELVSLTPGAVGLAPASSVGEVLPLIRLAGVLPLQREVLAGRYPLALQIVAAAPQEPSGDIRLWLEWIQAQVEDPQIDFPPEETQTPVPTPSAASPGGGVSPTQLPTRTAAP